MIGYSTFNSRPFIKDYLFAPDHVLAPGDLKGGMSFEESVNDSEELVFGCCVAGELVFEVDNTDGTAPNVTGKEYRWRKAVEVGRAEDTVLAKAMRPKAICGNGEVYYASTNTSFLSIWNAGTNTKVADIDSSIASTKAPEALYLEGNILYCLYADEPYVVAYFVSGTGFEVAGGIELTSYQIKQVKRLAKRGIGIAMTGDGMTEWLPVVRDNRTQSVLVYSYEWADMGYFVAQKPEKLKETKIHVTAYDRIVYFDEVVDEFLGELVYPITLAGLYDALCEHFGVEKVDGEFTNDEWVVPSKLNGENITGREVLQYIAQAAAGFCRMRADGKLELVQWKDIGFEINNSIYNSLETAEFVTDLIDKVQLRVTENDLGVLVGEGTNTLIIENNPLLYGETDEILRPAVEKIYADVSTISYQPFSVEMVQNPLIRAGDVFTIITRSGEVVKAYIMNRTMSGGLDTYEATGEQRRTSQNDAVNRMLQTMNGKLHELVFTVDEFSSTIKDMEGNFSSISQSISEIRLDINNSYVSLTDTNGLTIQAGGFRMINPAGKTVVEFDSEGTAHFEGDIEGSDISGSTIYFGTAKSGGELYGWSGKPSNTDETKVNAVTLESSSSLVLYAPEGVSISTDPKEVAVQNAGLGAFNIYGSKGFWCNPNAYFENNVRGKSFTLGSDRIDEWWEVTEHFGAISNFFLAYDPSDESTWKLEFENGILVAYYDVTDEI